jgi:hypothetical protein
MDNFGVSTPRWAEIVDLAGKLQGSATFTTYDRIMAVPPPEISGTSIIIVGEFSPGVFTPAWFVQKELLDEAEVVSAKIDVISSDVTAFTTAWLNFYSDRQRVQIVTLSEPIVRVYDLALGLMPYFPEAPVQMVGLNRDVHVKMGTEANWHRLGDMLAPKDCWPSEFTEKEEGSPAPTRWGGLRSLTMERPRETPPGYTHMRIEPSQAIKPFGVYFGCNDHYVLQPEGKPVPAHEALDLIVARWSKSMAFADAVRTKILEKVR